MTMLQKLSVEDDLQPPHAENREHLLSLAYYRELIKRRWLAFVVPFVVIAAAGIGVAVLLPATYLSEGKILVQSQQIPTELVRPTVTSAAQERIQVIEQRTMNRDNLIAIVDKFRLFPDKRSLMSVTELVALMKKQTKIAPVDLQLDFKQRSRSENPTIVFAVGFEYQDPAIASKVANELMTRILSEDLRDRTSRATDTTKFLSREVQKLQADNAAIDAKIAQLRILQGKPVTAASTTDQSASTLGQLRSELTQKGALYSDRHPIVQTLKRQIEALEKEALRSSTAPTPNVDAGALANIEALVAQQEGLQKNLESATTRLAAARLGENLEKDQQSEKLEIIEQPTVPQEPIKPNRPKVAGLAAVLALAAGFGLAFILEISDKGIRRSSDIFGVVDSQLVTIIPYIVTSKETLQKRRRSLFVSFVILALLVAAAVGAYLLLPPIDLLIAKARVGLFR
jgi:uncharacterized protein involved in exopolysaccharide biosynthesis